MRAAWGGGRYAHCAFELGRCLRHAVLVRVLRSLGAIPHTELAIDVVQVELHGLVGEPELFRDGAIGEPARHTSENLRLALAQAGFVLLPSRLIAVQPCDAVERARDRLPDHGAEVAW